MTLPEEGARPPILTGNRRSGLLLLRKPAGSTSFQALGGLKRRLGTGKVGHAGTLDRFASGLLVVLVGSYTRLNEIVSAGEKLYRGIVRFGAETDTLDPEGEVVAEGPLPDLASIESAIPSFTGDVEQAPPAYSALHVDGKRAYERVLAGESVELPARKVFIRSIELESFDGKDAVIRVACGPGTYIRSLARDLALACGSRASLVALERLAIGPFSLAEAVGPEEFDPAVDLRSLTLFDARALGLASFRVSEADERRFVNGQALASIRFEKVEGEDSEPSEPNSPDQPREGLAAVFSLDLRLLGLVEAKGRAMAYKLVLGEGA